MYSNQQAKEICDRLASLAMQRAERETVWRQVSDIAATDATDFMPGGQIGSIPDLGIHRANAARRSRNMYDGTAAWAVDRLASGLEGLIMPQSDLWHTLSPNDLFAMNHDISDEGVEWLEKLRDFMFRVRYDAASGWQSAVQTALRRLVAFGNGLIFVEEGHGGRELIRYRHLPISQVYMTEDCYGRLDGALRLYTLTARQARQKVELGIWQKLPAKLAQASERPADADRPFQFIHAIVPRADFGSMAEGVMRAPWASLHISVDDKEVLGESGYWEMPVIDFRWLPEPGRVYGEGPVERVLADIQSLNLMAKNEMIASQQAIDPPLLIARNGVLNRPDTNPGSPIVGGIDAQGREMVKPLQLGQRIDLAQAVIQAKRENLRESLYINLFALMVQTPRMSATESLIRANEKGELLGPAGSRIQESLSRLIQRELGILQRFGLFDQDSVFAPPRSVQGRDIGPKFTSPLDRLRRAKEAEAVIRTLEIVSPMGQVDQGVWDNFDTDETTRTVADVFGMPRRTLKTKEEVSQLREVRQAKQAMAEQLAASQAAAEAAHKAAPALETLHNIGMGA
jgi:hypothetical protein